MKKRNQYRVIYDRTQKGGSRCGSSSSFVWSNGQRHEYDVFRDEWKAGVSRRSLKAIFEQITIYCRPSAENRVRTTGQLLMQPLRQFWGLAWGSIPATPRPNLD